MKPIVIHHTLWEQLRELVPETAPSPRGGRPRLSDQAALNGILFVLSSGMPWEKLPQDLGYGSGMTCWRRLHAWQQTGIWPRLRRALQDRWPHYDQVDWQRADVEASGRPGTRRARGQS